MLPVIVAHGAIHGVASFAPLLTPMLFGAMLYYFVKKNPRKTDAR